MAEGMIPKYAEVEYSTQQFTPFGFTPTIGNVYCTRSGNIVYYSCNFNITDATSGNAQLFGIPTFRFSTIRNHTGTWYDNTNDESGEFARWTTGNLANVRFMRNGIRESFLSRIGHDISIALVYMLE